MLDSELEELLSDIESDRTERKSSLSDPDRVRQAICAFANDLPDSRKAGVVFVGASDDGKPSGIQVTDDLLLRLAAMRDDGKIQPFPSILVEKRRLSGGDVAIVIVEPSIAPPIRLDGRTWIRVGPRRAVATAEEERRLSERRRGRDLPFDIQPLPSATLDELDLDFFKKDYLPQAVARDVLRQNTRTETEQLQGLRFIDAQRQVTVLGMLVLGVDPRRFLPCDYVQFLRLDGTTLTDPIRDAKEIDGPLLNLLRRLDEVMEAHNETAVSITEDHLEVRRPVYPVAALQQLTRNAVLHRTYEGTSAPVRITWFHDRIEIQNPGGPFGQVTTENFGTPGVADYRNPHVAEAMKVLGYVQRFGVGIQTARRELEKNGNPPPEFQPRSENVLAVVRRRK
jgi:ATP-dependent DNA helicase RecG